MSATIYFAGSGADSFYLQGAQDYAGTDQTLTAIHFSALTVLDGNLTGVLNQYAYAPLLDVNGNSGVQLTEAWIQHYGTAAYYDETEGRSVYTQSGIQLVQSIDNSNVVRTIMFAFNGVYTWNATVSSWHLLGKYEAALQGGIDTKLDAFVSGMGTKEGVIRVYIDEVQVFSQSDVDLSAYSYFSYLWLGSLNYGLDTYCYSATVSDTVTLGSYLIKQIAKISATYGEWTGTMSTAIPVDVTQGVIASVKYLKETAKTATPSTPINEQLYAIAGVGVSAYVNNSLWEENQILLRYNDSDYTFSNSMSGLGRLPIFRINNTAPDGSGWSLSKFLSLEYGLMSGPPQTSDDDD